MRLLPHQDSTGSFEQLSVKSSSPAVAGGGGEAEGKEGRQGGKEGRREKEKEKEEEENGDKKKWKDPL